MKIVRETRPCPLCEFGRLEVSELHKGTQCSYCRKLIEMDFRYSAGIPVVLALVVTVAFERDWGAVGLTCTLLLVVFASGYQSVFTGYLPLKCYEK